MRIIIERNALLNALKNIVNIITSNNINPIFSCIKIEVINNEVNFYATNGITSAKYILKEKVKIDQPGTIIITGKILFNIISKINNQNIELETIEKSVLKIKSDKYECDINLSNDLIFPIIEFNDENWFKFKINSEYLKEINEKLISFNQNINIKNISALKGIYFKNGRISGFLEVIGSDSCKLGYLKFPFEAENFEFIIDNDNLTKINSEIEKNKEINFSLNNNNLIIKTDNYYLSCGLYDSKYPSAFKTLEEEYESSFIINKTNLIESLERGLNLVSTDTKPIVILEINNTLNVNFSNLEMGSSYDEIDIINKNLQPTKIAFNVRLLLDILKVIKTNEIEIFYKSSIKPIFIREPENKNFNSLLLPIKLF